MLCYNIIKVKENKKNRVNKLGGNKDMKLYEINEGFYGTQEEAIAMGEYHEVEATEEEIREYAMYGCPDADMQFLF